MKPTAEQFKELNEEQNRYDMLVEFFLPNPNDYNKLFYNYDLLKNSVNPDFFELYNNSRQIFEYWNYFYNNVIENSTKIKNVVFGYVCYGRNFPDDLFVCYSKNGKYYHENISLNIPEFNHGKLI